MNCKEVDLKTSDQYQQRVFSHIEEINNSSKPVVIFGAGKAGWYIMKVLEYYDVSIAAFCDNNPAKQNSYDKYRVLSAHNVAMEYPNAHVFLGVFVPETATAIQRQFQQMQFQHVHYDMAAFLFMYFVVVAGRICDQNVLAESIYILFKNYQEGVIHYGYTKDRNFVSPFVTSVITQKCSLRCRDCAQFIPYYKKPRHFPVESIIEDLKQYAKAFDVVPEISLHGGEPFLHPDIKKICKAVAAIPNIVFISFVTNGTIMLSEDTLQGLSACGADVNQSGGYRSLSTNHELLSDAFRRYNIYSETLFCTPTEMWVQAPPPKQHGRTMAANSALYKTCVSSKTCCQIMNGELHRCALSMHGSHQGLFPKFGDDFVRLHEPDMSDELHVAKIRDLLNRKSALNVCDYCDPVGGSLVSPAIQLSKI